MCDPFRQVSPRTLLVPLNGGTGVIREHRGYVRSYRDIEGLGLKVRGDGGSRSLISEQGEFIKQSVRDNAGFGVSGV